MTRPRPATALRRQRGVAALEFALIAILMISMLCGLLVWWRYFQAQQVITRAAGDGTRMAHSLISTATSYPCGVAEAAANRLQIQNRVTQVARLALQQAAMPTDTLVVGAFAWSCPPAGGSAPGSVSFTLSYRLSALVGNNFFIGEHLQLSKQGIVHFRPVS